LFTEGFSIIRGASESYPPKPFPDQAVEIGRKLDLPSTQIALVGDTEIDMQTALNSCFGALTANWGGANKFSSIVAHPSTILDTPNMVLEHIVNLN
jgi:phosphoglycolate phosphatase-like HAD superfamily hydrolase